MSLEVAKEPKEKFAKMISFWLKHSTLQTFTTVCMVERVERSAILRLLLNLFLNDMELQIRVLEGVRNNE